MIHQDHLALLHALSADRSGHSGRTLLDHLVGTHDLLEAWGNPSDTCVAGLFHSIYGTQYYTVQSADPADRSRIASVIGGPAEELAYLFSMGDRTGFFAQAGRPDPAVMIRAAGEAVPITPAQLEALLEIEVANCIEQQHVAVPERYRVIFRAMLERGGGLSLGAREALAERIGPA